MIESVKSQRGDFRIEHIIVDNCSSDGSLAILNEYAASAGEIAVRLIIEPDNGQSDAINKGFRAATGDVVCWLNADESYEPGALERVAEIVNEYPEYDIFFGDFYYTDEVGARLRLRRAYDFSYSMLLYYGCYIPSCATFLRRRIIDDGELLDVSYRVTMDFEYYLRLNSLGYRFLHLPTPVATFSLRTDNVSVIEYRRRRVERFRVQSLYSKLPCNRVVRVALFWLLEWYWVVVRVVQRGYHALLDGLRRLGK
jgi:glycosyltransferase involved in cell wall biosynthesis